MKPRYTLRAAAGALALAAAGGAHAAFITNADLSGASWSGFDWDSNGAALIRGFQPIAGTAFTLEVWSWAAHLKDGATNLATPRMDINPDGVAAYAGGYEYTLYASLQETVASCVVNTCSFNVTGGSWEIWYDPAQNAQRTASTGFRDGTMVLQGSFGPQPTGSFTSFPGTGGYGISAVTGQVGLTDGTFINPELSITIASSTLQDGQYTTNGWTAPLSFDGYTPQNGDLVYQADANQSFDVPAPPVLALLGSSLFGLALRRRRARAAC
jgi:hypothetical protein